MYNIEFLPLAKKDIYYTLYYISNELKNPTAATSLAKKIIDNVNTILTFPYGTSVYKTSKPLKHEYRAVKINNYLLFYTINEKDKIIIISRFIYQKMNINNMIG